MPSPADNVIDPQRVRTLFAAPERIAASAFLRREIAKRMHERLDLIRFVPDSLLDAGCGTGDELPLLHARYPTAQLAGVDLSPAMLAAARATLAGAQPLWQRLLQALFPNRAAARLDCADFARLPQADNSIGLLWSNLALHWHPQPQAVLSEWRRVLQTDGLLMFSCFGPDTLLELRRAFAAVDDHPHVLPFADMHDLGDLLLQSGFTTPVMDMEKLTLSYDSPHKLLAEVRALGGNPLAARRRGLLGRRAHARLLQAIDRQRDASGRIPLTIEVLYGHAFKPPPQSTSSGETVVRFMPRRPE
ncbi:MAG: methyltransferase protein [Burkholderiaceae bacterium]|nr:methyltransferase protein [Burkholderiaceae bacterium]